MYWKIVALLLALGSATFAQTSLPAPTAKHPFTFEDMMKLKRVDEPVPSPDGKWVVFSATDVDLEANTKISHLWIVPATGGESKRLNETPNHEERPRFSPDGKHLIWTSKATDPTQIWMSDFNSENGTLVGKLHQVTNISIGADGAIWSPDGKNIVFVSAVYADCKDDACNKRRDEELKNSKVKAKIFTRLLYRHWNAFTEFKRSHLFVLPADSDASSTASRAPTDLTPGDHDVPPFNLGGQDMYAISPDGQELAYTSNIDEVEATSTNNEIFVVPMSGGTEKKISTGPGADTTPLYSPDGGAIAWRSQARAGFEADKWSLMIYDRELKTARNVTQKFDRSVGSFAWVPVLPMSIFFTAEDHGQSPIFVMRLDSVSPLGSPEDTKLHADDVIFGPNYQVYFTRMSTAAPNEIWHMDVTDVRNILPKPLTHMNDALLSQIDMQPLESFTFKGANDEEVQGFMVKPPGFDPNKKYPLKFLIHGGP